MNCRTFQKNLEDYLENGLDFAGRFGMERHARQCIHCGKELTDAQELCRLVQGLDKVKSPPDFESSVLNEIGRRKIRRRFSGYRRFLAFGFDMPSWRKYAMAASALVVLGLGALLLLNPGTPNLSQNFASMTDEPANNFDTAPAEITKYDSIPGLVTSSGNYFDEADGRVDRFSPEGSFVNYHTSESDYGEYTVMGPDNLPMVVPLPNTIKVEIRPPSEAFFIRNVSH